MVIKFRKALLISGLLLSCQVVMWMIIVMMVRMVWSGKLMVRMYSVSSSAVVTKQMVFELFNHVLMFRLVEWILIKSCN